MKSVFKFCLLSALIIGGKLAKPSAPVAVAKTADARVAPATSVVLVHQVLTSEPVKPTQAGTDPRHEQPQTGGNGRITEMF